MALSTPLMLTPTEAAALARVSRATVYREIQAGRLETRRIGKTHRISYPALYRWLGTEGPMPTPDPWDPGTSEFDPLTGLAF